MGLINGELAVSNTELGVWQGCKRRWMLAYYDELSPRTSESVTGLMQLGSRLHVALEYKYGWDADPYEVLKIVYRHAKLYQTPDVIDELTEEHKLADKMIGGYLEWVDETGADEDLEVVSTERDVTVKGPYGVLLRARLDMRIKRRSDGVVMFLDHKTVGDFTTPTATLDIDSQMRFYPLVDKLESIEEGEGRRTDGGIYNMLKRSKRTAQAKPPFYQRIEVKHNDETLRSTYFRIHAVIGEILDARERLDKGEDHRVVAYPNPTRDCAWKCQFKALCPMMDDGSWWREMSDGEFTKSDPYHYYLPSDNPELAAFRKEDNVT